MGYPKVRGGLAESKNFALPVKDRAKFVKKRSLPTIKQMSTEKKGV